MFPIFVAVRFCRFGRFGRLRKAIERTRKQMVEAAKKMDFIEAAQYRDELIKLEDLYQKTTTTT